MCNSPEGNLIHGALWSQFVVSDLCDSQGPRYDLQLE
jgi:hypothetical protein